MKRLTREHTVPVGQRYRVMDPALVVEPGETILVETINHMSPIVRSEEDLATHGSPEYEEREETGPIFVTGARPGDALSIRIEGIEFVGLPHAHGSGPLAETYRQRPRVFPIEGEHCLLPGGVRVPVTPMVGDIYTTPATPEPVGADHGGNMDFTEVRPGNTLYLPVYHEGGLLVLGDVHAFQGDGEIFGEGGECAADVTVTLGIDHTYRHGRPLVETAEHLIGLASGEDLFTGIQMAVEDMTRLVARIHGLSEEDAYVLVCAVGSLRFGGSVARREMVAHHPLVGLSVPRDIGG